jgi:glycosyltransferase involved in cell wall biosynthesis
LAKVNTKSVPLDNGGEGEGDISSILDISYKLETQLDIQKQVISGFASEVETLKGERNALEQRLNQTTSQLVRAEAQFKAVYDSEFWRATKPARWALSKAKSIAALAKAIPTLGVSISPLQGVVQSISSDSSTVAISGSARYSISTSHLVLGWYKLSFRIGVNPNPEDVRAYVVTQTLNGDKVSQQSPSKFASDGKTEVVFHAITEAKSRELLLLNLSGPFSISDVSLEVLLPHVPLAEDVAGKLKIKNVAFGSREPIAELQSLMAEEDAFTRWIYEAERIDPSGLARIQSDIEKMKNPPLISVVIPTYETPRQHLITAIESVRAQVYPYWELLVSDDCSKDPSVREVLDLYASKESRIKVSYRGENGGISRNSNDAIAMASGDFVAFLDADDEISELALYYFATEIVRHPEVEFLFSDEDKISATGDRSNPYFKPSLSPELLISMNSVTHFGVYRRSTVMQLGGFRPEYDGSQDWDLALRFLEVIDNDLRKCIRIPKLTYHWRTLATSTATAVETKNYALEAGRKAVKDYLEKSIPGVQVVPAPLSFVRNRIVIPLQDPPPKVSILIPMAAPYKVIRTGLDSLLHKTDYPNMEILIDNGNQDPRVLSYLHQLEDESKIKVVKWGQSGPFNYSFLVNRLARHATGELLLLLNDDIEVIESNWLREMVSTLRIKGVGVVGAKLLYPDRTIQHAGVVIGMGDFAGHVYHRASQFSTGYTDELTVLRNYSAATGACLLIPKALYQEVGGLNEPDLGVAFNDVDLCLKVIEAGHRVVLNPHVRLIHHESVSRGYDVVDPMKLFRMRKEARYARQRWSSAYLHDNLSAADLSFLLHLY